nr:MAG TPA: hypothetical protein [Bacteriophage sp.]DAS36251.1 MAG TPA: hypothetical protein [Caudoviricetes sp.]
MENLSLFGFNNIFIIYKTLKIIIYQSSTSLIIAHVKIIT